MIFRLYLSENEIQRAEKRALMGKFARSVSIENGPVLPLIIRK